MASVKRRGLIYILRQEDLIYIYLYYIIFIFFSAVCVQGVILGWQAPLGG